MALVTVTVLGGHILEDLDMMGAGRMTLKILLGEGYKLFLLWGPVPEPAKQDSTAVCHRAVYHLFPEQEVVLLTVCLYSTSITQGSSEGGSGF